jgi:hypothetical protein
VCEQEVSRSCADWDDDGVAGDVGAEGNEAARWVWGRAADKERQAVQRHPAKLRLRSGIVARDAGVTVRAKIERFVIRHELFLLALVER